MDIQPLDFLASPTSLAAHLLDSEEFLAWVSGSVCAHVGHQQGTTSEQQPPPFQPPICQGEPAHSTLTQAESQALSQILWGVMGCHGVEG